MKLGKTLPAVVASIVLVLAMSAALILFFPVSGTRDMADRLLEAFLPSDGSVRVSFGSVGRSFFRFLQITDVRVSIEDTTVFSAQRVDLSLGLADLFRISRGRVPGHVSLYVSNAFLLVSGNADSGNADAQGEGGTNISDMLLSVGFDVAVSGMDVRVRTEQINADVTGIDLTLQARKGLDITGSVLSFDSLDAEWGTWHFTAASGYSISDSSGRILVLADHAGARDSVNGLEAALSSLHLYVEDVFSDFRQYAVLEAGSVEGLYSGAGAVLSDLSASVRLDGSLQDLEATVRALSVRVAYMNTEGVDMEGTLDNVSVDLLMGNMQDTNIGFGISMASGDLGILKAGVEGLSGFANISSLQEMWGQVSADKLSVGNVDSPLVSPWISEAEVDGAQAGWKLNADTLSVNLGVSGVRGNSPVEIAGPFSFSGRAESVLESFVPVQANVILSDVTCTVLPVPAEIGFSLSDGNARASVSVNGLSFDAAYMQDSGQADVRMNFMSFRPWQFIQPLESFVPQAAAFIKESTELDGSVSVIGLSGFDTPRSIPQGRFSINLAARGVALNRSEDLTLGVSLDGAVGGSTARVDDLAVTGLGYRFSYSGLVDLESFFPQGRLNLTNASDGSQVAELVFSLSDTLDYYVYRGVFTDLEGCFLEGVLEWTKDSTIKANSVFTSPYRSFPVDLELDTANMTFTVSGPVFNAQLSLEDNTLLMGQGTLRDWEFHLSDDTAVNANLDFAGSFDIPSRDYDLSFSNVRIGVSEMAWIGFDVRLVNGSIGISSFSFGRGENHYSFRGAGYLDYPGLSELFALDTSGFSSVVRLEQLEGDGHIELVLNNDNYSVDMAIDGSLPFGLTMLGERGNGFFATIDIDNLRFHADYTDGLLTIFNRQGEYSGYELSGFELHVNFPEGLLGGTLSIAKTFPGNAGNVQTGGTLEIEATLDSLASFLRSYAGLDERPGIKIHLRDLRLGDDYRPDDFDIDLSYHEGVLGFSGSVINGSYDINTSFVDITVDRSFPFSFSARGILGNEIDILLSDLVFPLPALMQFNSDPQFNILDGTVEGSILVKGPARDPSFYGMVYVSRFEMDLFWLPFQTIIANSLAVSINDHSLSAALTPAFGYSSETGQFFNSTIALDGQLENLSIRECTLDIHTPDNPLVLWIPLLLDDSGESRLNIRGLVTGQIIITIGSGPLKIEGDIKADNLQVGFVFPDYIPDWFFEQAAYCEIHLNVRAGKDAEFFYPDRDDPFLNFTVNEGQSVLLDFDPVTEQFMAQGNLSFKTGRIFYFQNDFQITEGMVRLSRPVGDTEKPLSVGIDLTARLRQYDSQGQQTDIYLILQNADLDNIVPRFESTPAMSESEIIRLLGQSFIPTGDGGLSLYSIASAASVAADTFSSLGLIGYRNNYSLTSGIRDALGLDMFSLRSSMLENLVLSYLPGEQGSRNLVAKYLNGTSLYAGKYLFSNLYTSASVMVNSGNASSITGLGLDIELSVDWDNEMGSFSIFTRPDKLSMFSFLDNIGFSFTKRILL